MPAVIADKLTFAAPPKCGTTWMLAALARAGVALERKGSTKVYQPGRVGELPALTFRRPPEDWLRSRFQAHGVDGPTGVPEVDCFWELPRGDFPTFVLAYLERMPGAVSRMFRRYAADESVALADLPGGLADVLGRHAVEFDRPALLACGPVNATPGRLDWPEDLLRRVRVSEEPWPFTTDSLACPARRSPSTSSWPG